MDATTIVVASFVTCQCFGWQPIEKVPSASERIGAWKEAATRIAAELPENDHRRIEIQRGLAKLTYRVAGLDEAFVLIDRLPDVEKSGVLAELSGLAGRQRRWADATRMVEAIQDEGPRKANRTLLVVQQLLADERKIADPLEELGWKDAEVPDVLRAALLVTTADPETIRAAVDRADDDLLQQVVWAFIERNQLDQAIEVAREIAEPFQRGLAVIETARELRQSGNKPRAFDILQDLRARIPPQAKKSVILNYALASEYARHGRIGDAKRLIERAKSDSVSLPADWSGYVSPYRIEALVATGELELAIREFTAISEWWAILSASEMIAPNLLETRPDDQQRLLGVVTDAFARAQLYIALANALLDAEHQGPRH